MKIEIKNLGQVKRALIDEKDLTVIVGDNGSGKTLLLEAKTFILNYYKKNSEKIIRDINREYSDHFEFETDWSNLRKFISDGTDTVKLGIKNPTYNFILKNKLKNDVRENINKFIKEQFEGLKQQTINELNREILMVEESDLDFNWFETPPSILPVNDIKCTLTLLDKHILVLEMSSEDAEDFEVLSSVIIDLIPTEDYITKNSMDPEIIREKQELYDPVNQIKNAMKNNFIFGFFKEITHSGNTLYLPSERNLFMDDALTKTLKESYDSRYSFNRNNSKIRFSEFLFNMAYLNHKDRLNRHKKMNFVLEPELQKIFGGQIVFDEEGDIKSIVKKDGSTIKRELFSTKQNRLIPYLILSTPFEHYSNVIIEEPEAHLSLKSIRELLSYFKFLIDGGIRITITTHSDVFFNHLNNFILRDKTLQTKVYELKFYGNESILEEKKLTELGYEIDLFTEELNNLYDETLSIQDNNEQTEN